MLKTLKHKILPIFLTMTFLVGNICLPANARAWNFDNNDEETVSLQNPAIPNGNAIVSISFRNTDVQQVLRMFADRAGLNFITIGEVKGTVTMDLVDTTLTNAINLITETSKLTYIVDNHTLIVMTIENAKNSHYSKKNIQKIPIKYVNASAVADFLNKNIFGLGKPGLSSGDIVVTDPSKNEIMIFGTQNDYLMAKKVIAKLDEKPITTTYKINNVTPKEMAQLVCDSLFPQTSDANTTKLAGTMTGAAGEALSIGAGEIACKISNKSNASNLQSFNSPPITVMYNSNLGTIDVIGGSNEQIQLINEFIVLHDKKQPQALLEFVVMELNEDGSHEFSNEWHWQNNEFPVSFTGGVLNLGSIIFFGRQNTVGPDGKRLNTAGRAALWDTITWLESNGKSKVLQKPTIVVTNGKTSSIDLTQDYVQKVDSQVSSSTYSQTPVTDRTYTIGKDQGMKIEILPFISPDGYVTMDLKVEYATPYDREYDYDELDNQYLAATLLERRNLALNAIRVKNGETLVLGGLIVENEVNTISKIPLLGDIPFLGVFFRNTLSSKNKSELVIIITPRLVEESEDSVTL